MTPMEDFLCVTHNSPANTPEANAKAPSLLVEGLGVGGGGRDVGVTGSLVRASGELELVGGLEVGIAGGAVGGGVILQTKDGVRNKPNYAN
jgi:hypothetical protein